MLCINRGDIHGWIKWLKKIINILLFSAFIGPRYGGADDVIKTGLDVLETARSTKKGKSIFACLPNHIFYIFPPPPPLIFIAAPFIFFSGPQNIFRSLVRCNFYDPLPPAYFFWQPHSPVFSLILRTPSPH